MQCLEFQWTLVPQLEIRHAIVATGLGHQPF